MIVCILLPTLLSTPLRDDIARLLGYKTHMHKTMEVRMAAKVSAVESMITSLLAAGEVWERPEG